MSAASRSKLWLHSLLSLSASGAVRFPVAILAIIAFAVISQIMVGNGEVAFERWLAALPIAGASSLAVVLFLESRGFGAATRIVVSGIAALALAGAVLWSSPFELHASLILPALLLAMPLAPFVGRGTAREFWIFALWTITGCVLAFLTVAIFCLGLQAILEMIRYLFDVALVPRLDRHLFVAAVTFVGPMVALGRIPNIPEVSDLAFEQDRLVRTVWPVYEWVQAPLLLVAAVILHAYAMRIVFTGEVPRNQIGWIVTTYSVLLIQLRIALDPFRGHLKAAGRVALRLWLLLMAVPFALLVFALAQRIGTDGVTLPRYLLLLWTVTLALMALAQAVPNLRGDIRILVGIPLLLLMFANVGPWGVRSLVRESQEARIASEVGSYLRVADRDPIEMTAEQATQLQTRLRALEAVGELDAILPMIGDERRSALRATEPQLTTAAVMRVVPIQTAGPAPSNSNRVVADAHQPLDVSGYDVAFFSAGPSGPLVVTPSGNGRRLTLRWNGLEDEADLVPFLVDSRRQSLHSESNVEADGQSRVELVTRDGRHIAMRPERIELGGNGTISEATLTVLLRADEWR